MAIGRCDVGTAAVTHQTGQGQATAQFQNCCILRPYLIQVVPLNLKEQRALAWKAL